MLLLLPGFSFTIGRQDFTALLQSDRNAFLRDYLSVLRGIGSRLKPRQFSGPQTSTGELLRTLLRIAASELTFQLSWAWDAL
jgi:hypothetical protein